MLTTASLLVVLALSACEADRARPVAPAAGAPAPAPRQPTVVFLTDKGEVPVRVDVARTPSQREQGLMWVEHLEEGRGMIFLMGPERILTFWMKNTYIPLDMIFLDAGKVVVGVVENAEPLTLSPRHVAVPSAYVVEVNGGWTHKVGIKAGVKARFEGVE